jgi:hypothetical protein
MRPTDPALEEIWAVRERIAAEHGFDIDMLYARYVALEAEHAKEDQRTASPDGAPPKPQ